MDMPNPNFEQVDLILKLYQRARDDIEQGRRIEHHLHDATAAIAELDAIIAQAQRKGQGTDALLVIRNELYRIVYQAKERTWAAVAPGLPCGRLARLAPVPPRLACLLVLP